MQGFSLGYKSPETVVTDNKPLVWYDITITVICNVGEIELLILEV